MDTGTSPSSLKGEKDSQTTMTMTTLTMERAHDAAMDGQPNRPERPLRRIYSAEYKREVLAEYEAAAEDGTKGAILRREGLYSSHITEWRRARDAGALAALEPRPRPRTTSPEQAELARLRRRAERAEAELAKARVVIDIQGKASELLGRSGLVGLDVTPLDSGHAIRGTGRYVGGILDALLSTRPEWCRQRLGLLVAGRQEVLPEVRAVWRSRQASFRPQDVGWIVAAVSDRAVARRAGVGLWHETDPGHPLGQDTSRALVTAYDLIPLLEPAVMAQIRPHRRLVYRLYLRRLRNARHILAISHTTAADLRSVLGIQAERVGVVYPAVRALLSERGDDTANHHAAPAIVFVGVPDPHKRPDLAVEALAAYRRMGGMRHLVFVGHHPPEARSRLRGLALAHGVARDVEFRDMVDDATLATLYADGVLLALSTREGFGLPPVECLLSGGRVVATPSPIYREVLADAPTFSRDDSPEAIGESLIVAEGAAAPLRAVEGLARRYSSAAIASELIRVYESLLG